MKKKRRTIELAPQTAEMFARCVAVLKEASTGRYRRYSSGLRSVVSDLLDLS